VVKKLFVTALAGTVVAMLAASGAEAAVAGRAPASGSASAKTVAYDWGHVPIGHHTTCQPGTAVGGFSNSPFPTPVSGIKGTITSIATSNSDSYALTASGAVYAWGHGSQGELGNGTVTVSQASAVRVDFPAGVKIAKLPNPMPYNGGMAISTTGTVYAWGNDGEHQFCQPGNANILIPIPITLLSHVTLAAGALLHTIYDSNGTVYSCGAGPHGQLGNGTSGKSAVTATPVKVTGLPSGPVAALTSAWGEAGVLMASGAYYDWGYNAAGQVGDGTRKQADVPVRVLKVPAISQVSEGGSVPTNGQTIAVAADGLVYVWGNGKAGQVGNGTTRDALTPQLLVPPAGVQFVKVNSGGATDYAIGKAGDLHAWGTNTQCEIGNGVFGSKVPKYTRPVSDHLIVIQVSSTAADVAAFGIR
jgi:alpha-tubulin suppressor-like RCC1 family protein